MNLLMSLTNLINVLAASDGSGLLYVGIGLAAIGMGLSGIGEGLIGAKTLEGMARNPEMYSKLRTAMIVACALDETTAIYSLLAIFLMMFL